LGGAGQWEGWFYICLCVVCALECEYDECHQRGKETKVEGAGVVMSHRFDPQGSKRSSIFVHLL